MKRWLRILIGLVIVAVLLGGAAFSILPLPGQIPVLMYHYVVPREQVGPTSLDVSTDALERQMNFLKRWGFEPISLDQLYAIKMGQEKPKGKQMAITFDDGNETYWQFALPILERYQVPSANFLIWDNVSKKQYGSMDLAKAKELAKNPLVTLGSHTLNHFFLPDVNAETARKEIFDSKKTFESVLGRNLNYFCYPGGLFSEKDVDLVKEAGYQAAFTTSYRKLKGKPETIYTLARLKVGPKDNLLIFWLKASGLATFGEEIRSWFLQLTGKDRNGTLHRSG